ncbi:MAG: class I SAM-dependent methyltransferase [Pseudomonadota bacterium]
MSRLDAFVHRVTAQRALIDHAVDALRDVEGVVFEIGLGNGRTFDHLRDRFPDREIYVFDRTARAHADSTPEEKFLIEGQLVETLPQAVARFKGTVALVHSDIGNQSSVHCANMQRLMNREIAAALAPGGILLSDLKLAFDDLKPLPRPAGIKPDWYDAWRRAR